MNSRQRELFYRKRYLKPKIWMYALVFTILIGVFGLIINFQGRELAKASEVNIAQNGHLTPYPYSFDNLGFTNLSPKSSTRLVFVSSQSGNDEEAEVYFADKIKNWRQPENIKPFKTLAKAYGEIRENNGDWLLVENGSEFEDDFLNLTKSGLDSNNPMVITGYGNNPKRPILKAKTGSVLNSNFQKGQKLQNLVIRGMDFFSENEGVFAGVSLESDAENILIEDNLIRGFEYGIYLKAQSKGKIKDVWIRRNSILQNFGERNGGAIFMDSLDGATILENYLNNNGIGNDKKTISSLGQHGIFVSENSIKNSFTVRNNIISNSGNYGIYLKVGGLVSENILIDNASGIAVARGNSLVENNLILGGRDIDQKFYVSSAIRSFLGDQTQIINNIITEKNTPQKGNAIEVGAQDTGSYKDFGGKENYNILIKGNIVENWQSAKDPENLGIFAIETLEFNNLTAKENQISRDTNNQNPLINIAKSGSDREMIFAKNTYLFNNNTDLFKVSGLSLPIEVWKVDFSEESTEFLKSDDLKPKLTWKAYADEYLGGESKWRENLKNRRPGEWKVEYKPSIIIKKWHQTYDIKSELLTQIQVIVAKPLTEINTETNKTESELQSSISSSSSETN